jgi:hypothetical protein
LSLNSDSVGVKIVKAITRKGDCIKDEDNSNLALGDIMGIFSGDKIPYGIISAAT